MITLVLGRPDYYGIDAHAYVLREDIVPALRAVKMLVLRRRVMTFPPPHL